MAKSRDQIKAARKARNNKNKEENKNLKHSKNWYPTTDSKKQFRRKCKTTKPTKLRQGITAGTVLILLAGRFRGKRVVFLKQLESGLLLVTGPYKLNGVPLKRVNQAYVIPTRTTVKLSNVPGLDKVTDKFFTRVKLENPTAILSAEEKRARITDERKTAQNNVDTEVNKQVKSTPYLKQYLSNRFALKDGQAPHNMKF